MSTLNRIRKAQARAFDQLKHEAAASGRPVQCRGLGCNGCCRGLVGLSRAEWADIRRRLTDADLQTVPDPRTVDLTTLRCPLLDEAGGCRVYEARPIACRGYAALTPAEHCDPENGVRDVLIARDGVACAHERREELVLARALAEEATRRGIPLQGGHLYAEPPLDTLDRQLKQIVAEASLALLVLRRRHGAAWASEQDAASVFARVEQGARDLGEQGWEGLVAGIFAALPPDAEPQAEALLALMPAERRPDFEALWVAQREAWHLLGSSWRPSSAVQHTAQMMERAVAWTPGPAGLAGHRLGALWVVLHTTNNARQFHLPRALEPS